MTPPSLSTEFTSWARRAGFAITDDVDAVVLYSTGGEDRYYVRGQREDGWWELSHASRAGGERFLLRAASLEVLERHLVGLLGVTARDELGLAFIRMPYQISDLAAGYNLSQMSDSGYRTLSRADAGPIAIARDMTLSLLTLVPLSHFLQLSLAELAQSFLDDHGSPLMSDGYYTMR